MAAPVRVPLLAASVAFAWGASVLGCSASPRADTAALVPPVSTRFGEAGIQMTDLSCPPDIEARAGVRFRCTATVDGGARVPVEVEQRSGSGALSFSFTIGPDLVDLGGMLPDVETALRTNGYPDVRASCRRAVIVADGRGTVSCDLQDERGTRASVAFPVEGGAMVRDFSRWEVRQG